jgi:hypothetical protein
MAETAAMYLAGHGSKVRPRLIELQHQRILRYKRALLAQCGVDAAYPEAFLDLRLPSFGFGKVDLNEVPGFKNLLASVQEGRFKIILIDIDEVRPGLTPDYESAFVRELLESFGATVLNAFTDDGNTFSKELRARCGQKANEDEITDGSDIVNFFPSLAGDIVAAALRKELDVPMDELPKDLNGVFSRIESLKKLRPYSGGGIPFVEDRLSREWRA